MGETPRDAYSIQETAKRWGVSDNTIRALIDTGQLYAFRVGRQLRIPTTELNRLANIPANPARARRKVEE
jgi:excisionase family DNA binding protein